MTDETTPAWEPVRDALLALADRLEQNDPDGPAVLSIVLDAAEAVTRGADQTVLAGMIASILTPEKTETNGQYAARLREEASD